ncbi:RluA family pseudouridine synthase [Fulvivirgaceae bacterium LMO-SS25]
MQFPEILFEDNHLLAVNKPAGLLVQGDDTGDRTLLDLAKDYIKEKYNKPGNVYIGLPHRLDRPVSGVVLLAKTSKALERLNKIFKTREVEKIYWALVEKRPNEVEGRLTHYLVKNAKLNITRAYSSERSESKYADLSYSLLKEAGGKFLLEVKPVTGRPHQIRVQLASMGCSIVGDLKYGSPKPNRDASICLHARSLKLVHPVTKEEISIVANPPAIFHAYLK